MAVVIEKLEWHGPELTAYVRQRTRAGLIKIAEAAALNAKALAPEDHDPPDVKSGTLKRSVTVGSAGQSHGSDYARAEGGEDLLIADAPLRGRRIVATDVGGGASFHVEVGSWIPYACVEEVRSPFIHPGVEMVRTEAEALMVEAFRT